MWILRVCVCLSRRATHTATCTCSLRTWSDVLGIYERCRWCAACLACTTVARTAVCRWRHWQQCRCLASRCQPPANTNSYAVYQQTGWTDIVLTAAPVNPLIATLKPQSNGPSYTNTVTGCWVGCIHLVQRGGDWAGPQPAQAPPRCTKCNSPPINGQCTNYVLFDVPL